MFSVVYAIGYDVILISYNGSAAAHNIRSLVTLLVGPLLIIPYYEPVLYYYRYSPRQGPAAVVRLY